MLTLFLAAALATNSFNKIENPARITSDSTYYDRREGLVVFKGHVHVDDPDYQMHANRAFLFLSETNSLKRIVAIGSVALTNGLKRAYGERVTYHRANGLIVLHAGDGSPAVVTEIAEDGGVRTVRGQKIRFWINQEQVEVMDADITAPRDGVDKIGLPGMGLK